MTSVSLGGSVSDLRKLIESVVRDASAQETDWLEWKSQADLSQRLWQARAARFILGAANRPRTSATGPNEGSAFLLLGIEPGQASGTNTVDPAVVEQGLVRFLGNSGPIHSLNYVTIGSTTVAVITVPQPMPGNRPYVARGSFSGERPEIQDGRIYIRRLGLTAEASAAEVDEMLQERVAVRVAAGPIWPMQNQPAWRDGNTIHVQQGRGDHIVVHGVDNYTNLAEMAAKRPELPSTIDSDIQKRLAIFDSLIGRANTEPVAAIKEAWTPLRAIVEEVYEGALGSLPFPGVKVVDMVDRLAHSEFVDAAWVDVSYPLYYWGISDEAEWADLGVAKTYLLLVKALATALLLVPESKQGGKP